MMRSLLPSSAGHRGRRRRRAPCRTRRVRAVAAAYQRDRKILNGGAIGLRSRRARSRNHADLDAFIESGFARVEREDELLARFDAVIDVVDDVLDDGDDILDDGDDVLDTLDEIVDQ